MKSKTARLCAVLLAALGFSQACERPDMYGPMIPDNQNDTTVRIMYGPFYSSFARVEPELFENTPAVSPETLSAAAPETESKEE